MMSGSPIWSLGPVWFMRQWSSSGMCSRAERALDTLNNPDPTAVRALTEASLLAFGAIGFLLAALFLAAAGYAILKTHMARLIGWVGCILAVLNVAAVPAIYKGSDFMETVIWGGNTASGLYSYINSVAGPIYSVWLVVLGLAILRNGAPGEVRLTES